MKSLESKYGGIIRLPFVLMCDIFEATKRSVPNTIPKGGYLFDRVEEVDLDFYKASVAGVEVLIDDSAKKEIIYFWRSKDGEKTIFRSYSRMGDISEKLDINDSRISQKLIKYSYTCFYKFLISDKDKSLQFKSFTETTQIDELTGEKSTSYAENGVITTPTEGWFEVLKEGEIINTTPIFEDEEVNKSFQLYGITKITDGINPKNLWLQDLVHSIRDNVRGKYLAQLSYRHFATDSNSASLRKSIVLTNKVKIILKLPGDLFVDRKASDIVYFIVFNPTETDMGIGKILFGDFTTNENKTRLKDSFSACIDFLKGDLITRPQGIRVMRTNELKEPFLLDPSKYVN